MNHCLDPDDEYDESATGRRRRRIDVTDMPAAGVQEFVRDSIQTDNVSLEHRGARTYLVVEDEDSQCD